jgi:hypothetical protein
MFATSVSDSLECGQNHFVNDKDLLVRYAWPWGTAAFSRDPAVAVDHEWTGGAFEVVVKRALLLWWAAAKQFVEKSHTREFLALRQFAQVEIIVEPVAWMQFYKSVNSK